ncbi:hypothetical protein PybrP1_001317 [[Pythium] brassicae (nom. inval.)]|nr:hypothetical protein PybrP1_001317 [[Pythium] brassicae (nom. inval.)]
MATDVRGGDLFRIRRVFSLAPDGARHGSGNHHQQAAAATPLRIEAMAVHTHEKKQLLALSVAEDVAPPPAAPSAVTAPFAAAAAALATHTISLGQLPTVEPRKNRVPSAAAPTGSTAAPPSEADRKKRAAALLSSAANYLLVRTVEEDERPRLWKFPVYSNSKQQSTGKREKLVALEFSPEGDWLAGLSSRKNRLHLIPVLALIARQRKQLLDAASDPPHNRELMSVHQSVMNTQMASYLRATNEAGGLNGARYHSQVAGDNEQMSTLEFAVGIGAVTCLRWWRSMNRKNYCLVGGSEGLVSVVNVEENAEECRCELQNAGAIVSIDLFRENFRKETRTTMLVKALGDDRAVRYYRVVLEKKFQSPRPPPPRPQAPSLKSLLTPSDAAASADTTTTTTPTPTTTVTSSFTSASGTPSFTTSQSAGAQSPFGARAPLPYVVKTFPQHFLEDMDFRPQRIKKNSPQICLYAINGLLSTESALAMYDPGARRASLYSNFQWSLRNEFVVPSLAPAANASRESVGTSAGDRKNPDAVGDDDDDNDDSKGNSGDDVTDNDDDRVEDVEIAYCTTDLLLLQGRTATSKRNVSTWVSLPSHSGPDDDDQVATAHIVHYLSLHGNEKIERVVQSTARALPLAGTSVTGKPAGGGGNKALLASKRFASGSSSNSSDRVGESQVIYVLQTAHHVYECRPQWSRLALFKTLCAQSIALRNALSIGYALGIDMASLCQVVAETLCENVHSGKAAADARTVQWIRDLFRVSRALPSSAIDQLTSIGGARDAMDFAQEILTPKEPQPQSLAHPAAPTPYVDAYERKQVALKLLDLVLREQLRANVSSSPPLDASDGDNERAPEPPRVLSADAPSNFLADKEAWLLRFLETSSDYDTEDIVDRCLAHQHVDKAVLVGRCRRQVRLVLHKIVRAGLAPFVSLRALRLLVADGFAPELTRPESRLILRAFPVDTQVDVLLAHPPAILHQRDWVVRNLPSMSRERCQQIAHCVDPRRPATAADDARVGDATDVGLPDVAASEMMSVLPEERVELFLTVLLFLNRASGRDGSACTSSSGGGEDDDSTYAQATLEQLVKELAQQYRPPVVVARCVDYENWTAAACVYEAHGELVEAVEARLQAHKVLRPVALTTPTSPPAAAGSAALSSSPPPSSSFSVTLRRRQSSDASLESNALSDESEFQDAMREELFQLLNSLVVQRRSERAITEEMKAAILARLLVKWFEYGLARSELEVFLIDPTVYPFVASLLAKIFFSEVVDGILGAGGTGLALDARSSSSTTPLAAVARGSGFDDRDSEWVRMCHRLPFSGQFLFHVCATFLDSGDGDSDSNGDSNGDSGSNGDALSGVSSLERRSAMLKLLDLVKANVLKNDLALPAVTIEPHSAHALGKSDPLETHVKAFTCGHVFPKRVFDEEIVPEFEKRLATLPVPLFSTRQVLLREFKRDAVEAPCPICAFNKISVLVQQQQQQLTRGGAGHAGAAKPLSSRSHSQATVAKPPAPPPQPEYYFLHAQGQQHQHGLYQHHNQHRHWRHEAWEWRALP